MKANKKKFLGVLAILVLAAVLGLVYHTFREKPVEGSKSVTIEVVDQEGNSITYDVVTEGMFLQQAMDDAEGLEYSGTEGEYGLVVDTVNGVYAGFDANRSYWGFFVNEEYCNYGIADQPVEDGDCFRIVYTTAE